MELKLLKLFCSLFISGSLAEETPLHLRFHQNDYKIKIEWGKVVHYNKQCWKQFDIAVFKLNRTCTAFNLTYISNWNMNTDVEVVVQVYKLSSNEYRQFPLRFEMNACTAIRNNLAGLKESFKCGNFTGCPVKKNKSNHVCNFTPDPSQFPPFIPNGRYQLEFQGLYNGEDIFLVHGFIEIYRPLPGQN